MQMQTVRMRASKPHTTRQIGWGVDLGIGLWTCSADVACTSMPGQGLEDIGDHI